MPGIPTTRGIVPDYGLSGVIAPPADAPQQPAFLAGFGPKFGRAWTIMVTPGDGREALIITNQNVPCSLEVRFHTEACMNVGYGWVGEVDIWNLSPPTAKDIQQNAPYSNLGGVFHAPNMAKDWTMSTPLVLGDTVTISAGYHNPADTASAFNAHANIIFEGRILSAYWTRVDVKDYVLRLHIVTNLIENIISSSFSLGPNIDDYTALLRLAGDAGITDISMDQGASLILTNNKYPTSQALDGKPLALIQEIIKTNMLWGWLDWQGLHVHSYGRSKSGDILAQFTFASLPQGPETGGENFITNQPANVDYTLIGTPEQTQEGVTFNVLMDSRIRIGSAVAFATGTLVNPAGVQQGQRSAVINTAGVYLVNGVRHQGNTMGSGGDWITAITAVTPNFFTEFIRGMSSVVKEK